MTKDSAKELLNNPAVKLAGLIFTQTAMGCALYFGLRSEIRENKAIQTGIDNVQDLRIQTAEKGLVDLRNDFQSFVSRDGTKSRTPSVENE